MSKIKLLPPQVKRFASQCGISIGGDESGPYPTMLQLRTFGDMCTAKERSECVSIALAIDSGRGNEKEIANAIRMRGIVK